MNCNSEEIFGSFNNLKTDFPNEDWVNIHLTWTIPQFVELVNNKKIKKIDSPIVTATPPGKWKDWKFQFKIKLIMNDSKINISYLSPISVLLLEMKSYLKYYNGEEKIIDIQDCRIVEANKPLSIVCLDLRAGILYYGDNKTYDMSKEGILILKFDFKVRRDLKIPGAQLMNDMETLFLEGIHTDVVMKSANNEEFRVHKAVLASRSPVLKAQFRHNNTDIVESPLESTVLSEVLLFIYTDKAPKANEFPQKLLVAADYYQLSELKSICEKALREKLTVDNAIEILQLADLYSPGILKPFILDFIKQDTQKLITTTEGWAKLQSVDLLKTIYKHCK